MTSIKETTYPLLKEQLYTPLLNQISSVLDPQDSNENKFSKVVSYIHESIKPASTSIYYVDNFQLRLGPHCGDGGIESLKYGEGLVGMAWDEERIIVAEDVEQFATHIPSTPNDRSELVIPVFQNGDVIALLNVNAYTPNHFNEVDAYYLNLIIQKLEKAL